jgi:hypothetical protein
MLSHRPIPLVGLLLLVVVLTSSTSAQVAVSIPNPTAAPNTALMIPVNITSLTGLNVTAYEFITTCDTSFVQFDGIDVAGTISSGQGVLSNNSVNGFYPGRMKVVCATALPISGSGILLNLKVTTKRKGGNTPIQLSGLVFNAGTPTFTLTNGSITVIAGLLPPVITPIGADTVAEGQTLQFTVVAADPNGLVMTYSSLNLPRGASLGTSTGQFTWSPDFTQAGSYSVRIKVSDTGLAADSITVPIAVTNVNRKPVFNSIPAKIIRDYDTLNVALSAVDPDNDPVTYTLVSLTPTATTTPVVVGSTLKWIPAFADTGKTYSIAVRVSDNVLTGGGVVPGTDSLAFSVTVNRSRVRGDVDANGKIQAADAALVLKHVASIVLLTNPAAIWAAIVTGTSISAACASVILQAAAGMTTIPNQ